MISLVNHKPFLDGQKLKVDKTSSSEVVQISPFLAISKELSLNSRMSSFQEAIKSSLPEKKDNNWIEDYFFSNTKYKDFLNEESIFQ